MCLPHASTPAAQKVRSDDRLDRLQRAGLERLHHRLVACHVVQLLHVLLRTSTNLSPPLAGVQIRLSGRSAHTHTPQIASYGSQTLGMSYSAASVLVIIVNGVGFPFRVLVPLFSDRFGPLNVLIPVLFLWSAVAFCWLAVGGVAGYYVWTAFYGALSASFQCLIPTTVTSITPRLDKVGTRMGMAFGIISFAAMTGPPVGGALQTAQGGEFTGAQVWAACATLAGAVLCFVARSFRAGGLNPKVRC